MTDPVWDGVTIDFDALKGYGWYSDVIDVGGVSYPRLTGYQVAGLNEMGDRINAAALTFYATSGTSVVIGTGAKTTTIAADKGFTTGSYVIVYDPADGTRFMLGQVTAYSAVTGVLAFTVASGGTGGSGTITAPSVSISGPIGPAGATPADASDTVKGIAELATQAETDAGTDDARIITPLKRKAAGSLFVKSQGLVAFRLVIINSAGTLQHKITALDSSSAATFAALITSASATLGNTPTGADSSTAFATGGKLGSPTAGFIFNTAAQTAVNIAFVSFLDYNDSGTALTCLPFVASRNVNGTTLVRPEIRFFDAASGANFGVTTGTLTSSKQLNITVLGFWA